MVTTFVRGERPRPAWVRDHPRAWLAAVTTVCFGAFMGQLDASVVALTYHAIGREFTAPLGEVQWISLSYLITLGALLVPLGRVSDTLGRKRIYLWGFGVFTLASAGCALAPSLGALVGLRAAQGAGAAMLQANSVALVSTSAPRARLRTALGIQAAAQAIGLAIGPTVGGVVVQYLDWRWVFALNIPVGVIAMVSGRYLLPRTRIVASDEPDARTRRREIFVPGQVRHLLGALLGYLLLFGPIVLVPTVLQDRGVSPLHAGLVVAALPAGFAIAAALGERALPGAWSGRRRCALGLAITLAGCVCLLVALPAGGPTAVAAAMIGLGLGVFTPANNAAIMGAVPARVAAVTGGLLNTARAAGTAAGTALVALTVAVAAHGRFSAVLLAALACVSAATLAPHHRRFAPLSDTKSDLTSDAARVQSRRE